MFLLDPLGALIPEKKPRGRPPRSLTAQKATASLSSPSSPGSPAQGKPDQAHERSADKVKRLPGRPPGSGSGEKRRGRPPSSSSQRAWHAASHAAGEDGRLARPELAMEMQEEKDRKSSAKRALLGSAHQQDTETKLPKVARDESKVTKLKRLREVKLSPLKSHLKALPGVPRRRRGRPPSAERLKAEAEAAAAARLSGSASHPGAFRRATDQHALQQAVDDSEQQDSSPPPSKLGRPLGLRQSPRHIKPVRIVPSSKRTDATIAKQLLQRAKKGAQKKKLLEKDAVAIGGPGSGGMEAGIRRRRRTQLKNIRQFIMPVVSTVSLRIIKTPKRFIEEEGSFGTPPHHMKMARLETPPTSVSTPPQLTSISSSPSPVLVSSTAAAAAASTGTTAPVDSLPPPPPPASDPSIISPAAGLLNNSTNSTANGRFSSSAASCGSSALSQHSSQLSSAESSRSSSPSLDDSSCDSQASEATQALSETDEPFPSSQCEMEATLLHSSRPPSPSSEREHVVVERDRGSCRPGLGSRGRGTLTTGAKKPIISPATGVLMSSSTLGGSQQASSAASSSSSPPPPPLLSPPQPPQSASSTTSAISEHHAQSPWMMPHSIPPFLPGPVLSSLQDKRNRSILKEPTFRWTSLSRTEQCFSSAKYAKEGLIRKPVFDNFRPAPLTAQDVGLMPQGAGGAGAATQAPFQAPSGGATAGTRLFTPLHHPPPHQHPSSTRFEAPLQKRSLLRAPRFTPSEAHSRIFESVTLQSSSGSSPGSLSPHQSSGRAFRRKKRRTFLGMLHSPARSPSHSMTRRSSRMGGHIPRGKGSSERSTLSSSVSNNPSSLPGASASPLATSALTPAFSPFAAPPLALASQGTRGSRGATEQQVSSSSTSSSASQLFPLFPSSVQETGRGAGKGERRERSLPPSQESAPKEKEKDLDKSREREKENKREGKRDWGEKKGGKVPTPDASPNVASSLFIVDGRETDDGASLAPKKAPGRKKSTSADVVSEPPPPERLHLGRQHKKGRPSDKEAEPAEEEKEMEKPSAVSQPPAGLPAGQPGRQQLPAPSLGSMLAQAEKQPVTDKQVVGLLKKAKAQLFKIEKSKSLKSPDQPKIQVCLLSPFSLLFNE